MNRNNDPQKRCQGTKRDGRPCNAYAITDSRFCVTHDPSRAEAQVAARRKGGENRSRRVAVLPADTLDRVLDGPGLLTDLLSDMMNKILRGELDPKIAYAVGYLATIQTKTLAQIPTEERQEREQQAAFKRAVQEQWKKDKAARARGSSAETAPSVEFTNEQRGIEGRDEKHEKTWDNKSDCLDFS